MLHIEMLLKHLNSFYQQDQAKSTVVMIMEHRSGKISSLAFVVLLLYCCFSSDFVTAIDTITSSLFIRDPETITSSGSVFKLGFFTPPKSTNRYVGIWFDDSTATVVWVANRNTPLNDSSGIVTISEDGNLVVLNGQKQVLWSSNVSDSGTKAGAWAQLLDSGNLVLHDSGSTNGGGSVWESFQEPTDTLLPTMKLSTNLRTGEKVQLTSWKSPSDPSIGSFSVGIGPLYIPQVFTWNDNRSYWRAGPWNGAVLIGVANMKSVYLDGFTFVAGNGEDTALLSFTCASNLTYFVLTSKGQIEKTDWVVAKEEWQVSDSFPRNECDVYGKCGEFGSCNSQKKPICSCLRGFEPKNLEEWSRGNWSSGCVRRRSLQCEMINKTGEGDRFLKLKMMKVPDFVQWSSALKVDCRDQCLNNCSCVAYAFDAGIGCMTWTGKLIDTAEFSSDGTDLYIRVARSELDKNDTKVIIIVAVIVLITISTCTLFSQILMAKHKAMKQKRKVQQFDKGEVKLEDQLFNFEKLATATDNFNLTNKLGQGGFGPVYWGKLEDGQEIAVKRLSKSSGQGLEEFMNEVVLISNLHHRNLVRLLGCCVEGEEKMLIYEYMPNKSLDAFLFDALKQEVLDWRKRFNIVEGIGRGLLYLHRDSVLRIIHRDLKASNILLDEELNPKISDFGMARIFRCKQDQANTLRVVGTYGYMSPEYAMEGRFSEKSDVFSFGVLLLEIVSGRKNTSFYDDTHSLSLLGYVWKLWNEDHIVALIDQVISEPHFQLEITRCIHVGLLCVQEFVEDRPSMSTVMSMLNSEIMDLPTPKQPPFIERQSSIRTVSSEASQNTCSINHVTVSIIEGR